MGEDSAHDGSGCAAAEEDGRPLVERIREPGEAGSMTSPSAPPPEADEFQVSRAFYDAYKRYNELLKAADHPKPEQIELDKLLSRVKAVAWHVNKLRLFSPNEELDDISTVDLKYLLVPFLLGEVSAATLDMTRRLEDLKMALVYWRAFAHDCERLGIVHAEDVRALGRAADEPVNAADKRTEKIERYRRSKELDQKISYLFGKKREASGDEFMWGSYAGFDEEMERELVLALLSWATASSAESIASAQQEMPMLEIMAARGGPGAGPPARPPPTGEMPWVVRIQDRAELQRLYLQQVFQPDIPLPTMTLAEAAQLEMDDARERQADDAQRRREHQAELDERWFRGDRRGSQEEHESEQKTYKDRSWDDWKDEHPYGSGNKGGNIG